MTIKPPFTPKTRSKSETKVMLDKRESDDNKKQKRASMSFP